MRYFPLPGALPLRLSREKVSCGGRSLLGPSVDPEGLGAKWRSSWEEFQHGEKAVFQAEK